MLQTNEQALQTNDLALHTNEQQATIANRIRGTMHKCLFHIIILLSTIYYISVILLVFFRMHLASSKWSPKRRVAYIYVGEPSELGSL
jgi:hypothetical protein